MDPFSARLDFAGNIDEVLRRTTEEYKLGKYVANELIVVGLEDYNVRLQAEDTSYLVKIFSKKRDTEEIERYVKCMEAAATAGVRHPKLLQDVSCNYSHVDSESDLNMVVMEFIEGKTFYDIGEFVAPNDVQLQLIATEAVKINNITYEPPYIFDSWGISNIQSIYDQTKQYLSDEGNSLVCKVLERYNSIPLTSLPKCFVHGDITKTNTIMSDQGGVYIIDFAVANIYPRVQELAVMSANLLFDGKTSLLARVERVVEAYLQADGELTSAELNHMFDYALAATAMEYMGGIREKNVNNDTSNEIEYWITLGLEGLREAITK